ncbi:hypothetical protein [Butyrivibrio fibrisolvens]|uniref:hypothetical protein n=1 Tax=Butyrivibrio fibrisolvens TaxID=831 RepID=UPI0020C0FFAB|nr:hypothetical protein [Butyrivibrio fibrisolvens]
MNPARRILKTDSFTKDTTLYGDFRAAEVSEDTRHWYIAGTSKTGSLALNNWAADLSDEDKAQFELVPTGNAVNEFSLTIDLYEGDQFQIIPDWSWMVKKATASSHRLMILRWRMQAALQTQLTKLMYRLKKTATTPSLLQPILTIRLRTRLLL